MQARYLPNASSISNTGKMVPEGGFEPPTRGFSKSDTEIMYYFSVT